MSWQPRILYGCFSTLRQYSKFILFLNNKGIEEHRKINDLYAGSRGKSGDNLKLLLSLKAKPECRGRRLLVFEIEGNLLSKEKMIPNRKMAVYAEIRCVKMHDLLGGHGR